MSNLEFQKFYPDELVTPTARAAANLVIQEVILGEYQYVDDVDAHYTEIAKVHDNFVLLDNGIVVATGAVALDFSVPRTASLDMLAVIPNMRKQGYGRRMVNYLEIFARVKGAQRIELQSLENSVGFYERLEYKRDQNSYDMWKDLAV